MVAQCPSINTAAVEQENFLSSVLHGDWDAHRIGWTIAGCAAALTLIISLSTVLGHALHFHKPAQQRQVIRILLFAPVFAISSFFSYIFFRYYTYIEVGEVMYEAIAIAAFLMLCLAYLADGDVVKERARFAEKDKTKMPIPLCCFQYRPSKAYFLYLLKFSVVQYVIIRPLLSVAGIVTQYYGVLCNESYSYKYAHVYLTAIDFASISLALMALIVLYDLLKSDLKGRRPLAKFLTIKGAIFFTFYQSFVFSVLQDHGVIKATQYWTSTNVANGLNALATVLEMVIVAAFQAWAFHWGEYREYGRQLREQLEQHDATQEKNAGVNHQLGAAGGAGGAYNGYNGSSDQVALKPSATSTTQPPRPRRRRSHYTNPFYALFLALWLGDLFYELWYSLRFALDRMRRKEWTRADYRYALEANRQDHAHDGGIRDVASPPPHAHDDGGNAAGAFGGRRGLASPAPPGRTRTGMSSATGMSDRRGVDKSAGMDFNEIFAAAAAGRPVGGAAVTGGGDDAGSFYGRAGPREARSSFGTGADEEEEERRRYQPEQAQGYGQQQQRGYPPHAPYDAAAGAYGMQAMSRGGGGGQPPSPSGYAKYDNGAKYAPQQQSYQPYPASAPAPAPPVAATTGGGPHPPASPSPWMATTMSDADRTLVDNGRYRRPQMPYQQQQQQQQAQPPYGSASSYYGEEAMHPSQAPPPPPQQQQFLTSGYGDVSSAGAGAAGEDAARRFSRPLSWEPQAM